MDGETITRELKHFALAHIKTHGKDYRSRKYLRDSLDLWRREYGPDVARNVEKAIKEVWK